MEVVEAYSVEGAYVCFQNGMSGGSFNGSRGE